MFCKNCGKSLGASEEKCEVCGFKVGFGTKYCATCGEKLDEASTCCKNCGNEAGAEENSVKASPNAVTNKTAQSSSLRTNVHEKDIFVINVIKFSVAVVSLLLVVATIFVPIFRAKFQPSNLDEIENMEQFESVLVNGYIEKDFSYFEELQFTFQFIFGGEDIFQVDRMLAFICFYWLPIILLIMAACLLFEFLKQLSGLWINLFNRNNAALLRFGEIKKTGKTHEKVNFLKRTTIYSLICNLIFDVFYCKFLLSLLDGTMSSVLPDGGVYRYMLYVSGISGWSAVVFVLLGIIIIGDSTVKYLEKRLNLKILKEEIAEEE